MEADFFEYYGLDITQMGSQGLSFARVERLMLRLPHGSRLMLSLLEKPVKWTMENEQLASIYDALTLRLWQAANEGKKKHQWSKQPDPFPRPSDIGKEKQDKADLSKKLLEQRERLYAQQDQV